MFFHPNPILTVVVVVKLVVVVVDAQNMVVGWIHQLNFNFH